MNILIKDVLSNPTLLNNVSEEVLQQWKQQYPYVSLFHLYALKKKTNYTNVDLHNTAFHFNNREKLYYLLQEETILQYNQSTISNYSNNTSITTDIFTTDNTIEDEKNSIEERIAIETNNEILDAKINKGDVDEIQETATTPINTITNTDEPLSIADKILLEIQQLKKERENPTTNEVNEVANTIEESIAIETPITEVVTSKVDEISETDSTIETNVVEIENTISTNQIDSIEETDKHIENATKIEVENTTDNTEKTAEPLSIAEKILLEIEQLKKERENPTVLSEQVESKNSVDNNSTQTEAIFENSTKEIENIDLVENEHTEIKETTETTTTEQTSYSIQDEVIARIQKIKEERENPTVLSEQVESKNSVDDNSTQTETNLENSTKELENIDLVENEHTEIKETTETTTTENTSYSIQDEVIARIHKIKEEREFALLHKEQENSTITSTENTLEVENKIEVKGEIETVTTTIIEEANIENIEEAKTQNITNIISENTIQEIAIVEKSNLANIKIEVDEITDDNISNNAEQDIILKETKEINDVQKIIKTPISEVVENLNEQTSEEIKAPKIIVVQNNAQDENHFTESFPTPLLVKINFEEIVTTKIAYKDTEETETKEQNDELENQAKKIPTIQTENISVKEEIKSIINIEEKTEASEKDKDILVDNKDSKSEIENTKATSPTNEIEEIKTTEIKDAIFIPEITVNSVPENDNTTTEITAINLSLTEKKEPITIQNIEPTIKEEPHTFIEWLQMLDGNLQIQTTETVAEKEIKIDNWIEIPRYEVEQTITNKKAIQKEEQKLFEPNFEEGEIDLFHEIDEEVTKIATESVQFKNDMMTETLAKIYYKQGKLDKALEIYNTLLIKNPEKSAYFASLIEKIEKEK